MKPKLAVFPKCYMDELCVHHTMTLCEWIEIAATLGVDGLEFYSGFLEDNEVFLKEAKASLERHRLQMPMLCCSPDFTQTDPDLLQREIDREIRMIEIAAFSVGGFVVFCPASGGQS
jgi:sugar phosphate isomerase/epimerase